MGAVSGPTVVVQPEPVVTEHRRASPPPAYMPALWSLHLGRERRRSQERDSLRSRSKEGRPGSRKHRRWSHSVELVGSLRRAMVACGEPADHLTMDAEGRVDVQVRPEWRPSAFYLLLEREGPGGALDAWEAAERTRCERTRPPTCPVKAAAQVAKENQRVVRRAFGDMWQFVRSDCVIQDLLRKLEGAASKAFGLLPEELDSEECSVALQWILSWDGSALQTKAGAPPANEMVVSGLEPAMRKVVHSFAQALGLRSSSRVLDEEITCATNEAKVLSIRPPHGRTCGVHVAGAWVAPFSVAQIVATA